MDQRFRLVSFLLIAAAISLLLQAYAEYCGRLRSTTKQMVKVDAVLTLSDQGTITKYHDFELNTGKKQMTHSHNKQSKQKISNFNHHIDKITLNYSVRGTRRPSEIPKPRNNLINVLQNKYGINMPSNSLVQLNLRHTNPQLTPVIILYHPDEFMRLKLQELVERPVKVGQRQCEFHFGGDADRAHDPYNVDVLWNAVMFIGHDIPVVNPPPRDSDQVAIFYDWEPPISLEMAAYRNTNWDNYFNWTVTYRHDSDVRMTTVRLQKTNNSNTLQESYSDIYQRKRYDVVWYSSVCETRSSREVYVNNLRKYITVDNYGKCGQNASSLFSTVKKCDKQCIDVLSKQYKFVLIFEDVLCKDYISETVFSWFNKGIIPVVRGGADYSKTLPPGSYIDTREIGSANDLTKLLRNIGSNEKTYTAYLRKQEGYAAAYSPFNKGNFTKALNSVCKRLYDLENNRKSYKSIVDWWDMCQPPADLDEK